MRQRTVSWAVRPGSGNGINCFQDFFFPVSDSVIPPLGFISLATNSLGKTESLFILLTDLDVFQPPHTRKGEGEAIYSKTCVGIPS